MHLYKNLATQIILLVFLTFWSIVIGFRSTENWISATALFSALILLILIPFAAAIKNREDWNDFFSVFMLILYPLHSHFIIHDFHSNLLYSYNSDLLWRLWIPYLFQSIVVINYLVVYLKDYYPQYSFYRITALSVLNHGLIICSFLVIILNSIQFQSDKSLLNELIAREIKPLSVSISDSQNSFFPYLSVGYSTITVKPANTKEFLLPIRDRVIMEYQGDLFESTYIEKKAFSNEILFKSPKDTFVVEIIQLF